MAITRPNVFGLPRPGATFAAKARADLPPFGQLVEEFDLYQQGYAGALVYVFRAGTEELAELFYDENMTRAAPNPQTLTTLTQADDTTYGKFAASIYTPYSYTLDIDTVQGTGVKRPAITDLAGQTASLSFVRSARGTQLNTLADIVARQVHVQDFGSFSSSDIASPATNTATLEAAVGSAAALGGAAVILPSGTFVINTITLPASVILKGQGMNATILRSQAGGVVVTVSGDRAGLQDLTLDGVSLVSSSVGLFSRGNAEISLRDCKIMRFAVGVRFYGGTNCYWSNFNVSTCERGLQLIGTADDPSGGDGDEFTGLRWASGTVEQCTTMGLEMAAWDLPCRFNAITDVDFNFNLLDGAVVLEGCQHTTFQDCYWDSNTINLDIFDGEDGETDDTTSLIIKLDRGAMYDGTVAFDGRCEGIVLEGVYFSGVTAELSVPDNTITMIDCNEGDLTITGDSTKLGRYSLDSDIAITGRTTDATAKTIWHGEIEAGAVWQVEARVVARQINGTSVAAYNIQRSFKRGPDVYAFDNQTANFTIGDVLTGAVSGAQGILVAQTDAGATGTLSLVALTGEFLDNETVTGVLGGSALINGGPTLGTVTALGSDVAGLAFEDVVGWGGAFSASGQEAVFAVTGAAATTIDWTVRVLVTRL